MNWKSIRLILTAAAMPILVWIAASIMPKGDTSPEIMFWTIAFGISATLISMASEYGSEGSEWRFRGVVVITVCLMISWIEFSYMKELGSLGKANLCIALFTAIALVIKAMTAAPSKRAAQLLQTISLFGTMLGLYGGLAIGQLMLA